MFYCLYRTLPYVEYHCVKRHNHEQYSHACKTSVLSGLLSKSRNPAVTSINWRSWSPFTGSQRPICIVLPVLNYHLELSLNWNWIKSKNNLSSTHFIHVYRPKSILVVFLASFVHYVVNCGNEHEGCQWNATNFFNLRFKPQCKISIELKNRPGTPSLGW